MKTIDEMKKLNLPRMTQPDFIQVSQGTCTVEKMNNVVEAINEYLKAFAKPEKPGNCISCGTAIGGVFGALFGGWREGIAHGEGSCGGCGYPGRFVHTINDKNGELIVKVSPMILQYHPDVLETKEESTC